MRASDFASVLEELAATEPAAAEWCALLAARLRERPSETPAEFAGRLSPARPAPRRHAAAVPAAQPPPASQSAGPDILLARLSAARLDIRSVSMEEIDQICSEAAALTLSALRELIAQAGFVHLDAPGKARLLDRLAQTLKNARASHH